MRPARTAWYGVAVVLGIVTFDLLGFAGAFAFLVGMGWAEGAIRIARRDALRLARREQKKLNP